MNDEQPSLNFDPPKTGFHVIKLAGSKKLQRLHRVLMEARGRKLTSFELTVATHLINIATWISHLRHNRIAVQRETARVNGQTIWRYWIEDDEHNRAN